MMATSKLGKNRRGISPAITSIILIGVAVAAGIGGYTVYASTANTASLKGAVTVEAVSLVKQSNGEEYLSITIKNSGNKAFASSSVNLQIDTDSASTGIQPFSASPLPAALNPGQTASVTARLINSAGTAITLQNIGETTPLEIVVVTTDGSTISELISVTMSLS
ncbi:MAG TPA: archaellin/type IV pilin N-terminal domain-containing protein [Candidatus Nitrosotenuis sp.]